MVDQTTHPPKCHSFVGLDRQIGSSPPALLKGEKKEKEKKEKFYIYLDVTHTPGRSRVNPERQEEGKADTDDGQKARTARGGRERTDLQNQPTRRNGPDKNRAHLNPTKHCGEAQGKN